MLKDRSPGSRRRSKTLRQCRKDISHMRKDPGRKRNTHYFAVDHYVVFYTVDNGSDKVNVFRIMYSARDIDAQLLYHTKYQPSKWRFFFCPAFSQSQPSLWPGLKADKLTLLLTKPLEPFLNASRGLFFWTVILFASSINAEIGPVF